MGVNELASRLADWEQLLEDYRHSEDPSPLRTVYEGLDQLCDSYLQATPEQREAIRRAFDGRPGLLNALMGHVHRATRRIQSAEDTRWLLIGLAATSIEDKRMDFRDTYVALGELYLAAARAGIDPDPHIKSVAAISSQKTDDGQSMRAFIGGFRKSAYFKESVASRLEFISASEPERLSELIVIGVDNAKQVAQLTGLGWGVSMIIPQVVWSPDGAVLGLATGNAVRLHALDDFQASPRKLSTGKKLVGRHVAFDPAGELVAAGAATLLGDDEPAVHIWELQTGTERAVLEGAGGTVVFSPHGGLLASNSPGGRPHVILWDVGTGQQKAILEGRGRPINHLAFSPDGSLLAACSRESYVLLWDVGQQAPRPPLTGHERSVTAVAFSPDGAVLASASKDRTVRLWDVATGGSIARIDAARSGDVNGVAFCPDGSVVASCGSERAVKLWSCEGRELLTALKGHTAVIGSVSFNPQGTLLASSSLDGTVRLWGVH